jgi:hypothetical protein
MMSTVKKGMLTASGEWARHLRRWGKRIFWHGERAAERQLLSADWDYERRAEDALLDEDAYWPARDEW